MIKEIELAAKHDERAKIQVDKWNKVIRMLVDRLSKEFGAIQKELDLTKQEHIDINDLLVSGYGAMNQAIEDCCHKKAVRDYKREASGQTN